MLSNSEFRRDLVSKDWVVIAPKRTHSLEQFFKKEKRKRMPKGTCPFEDPQKSGNGEPVLLRTKGDDWTVQVIQNKFPALAERETCAMRTLKGPYEVMEGSGRHDIVITRDHDTNFAHLSTEAIVEVFEVFQERYRDMMQDTCVQYVSMFHNWGVSAGASVFHPHCQMLFLPIIPPDVFRSLHGSELYHERNDLCVHCVIVEFEKKEKKRVVYENKGAIVFAPLASREPFELRVFPKKHLPYFEDTDKKTMQLIADALRHALHILEERLNDPDYNFFIHTAPVKDKEKYGHYHWHIEIQPKTKIDAGFELGTGIEINVVDPDDAVVMLRGDGGKSEKRKTK